MQNSRPKYQHSNWQACLELEFSATPNGSKLCKNLHQGPLMVQKPFYPESPEVCHVYLLHPPGGVVHGDQLNLKVNLQAQAHALITTPAAGKFYRSHGKYAELVQTLHLHDKAKLEWLPQETLLFNRSQVKLKTIIKLRKQARFMGWEMLCLGRKASAEPYSEGQCIQHFEVWRDDSPLFLERSQITGGSEMLSSKWGMNNWPLTATFISTHCTDDELQAVQTLLKDLPIKGHISATLKYDALICRFLGEQAEHARKAFTEVWKLIRPVVMEQKVQVPRIWNT